MLKYCEAPHARFIIKHVVVKLVRELGVERIRRRENRNRHNELR